MSVSRPIETFATYFNQMQEYASQLSDQKTPREDVIEGFLNLFSAPPEEIHALYIQIMTLKDQIAKAEKELAEYRKYQRPEDDLVVAQFELFCLDSNISRLRTQVISPLTKQLKALPDGSPEIPALRAKIKHHLGTVAQLVSTKKQVASSETSSEAPLNERQIKSLQDECNALNRQLLDSTKVIQSFHSLRDQSNGDEASPSPSQHS